MRKMIIISILLITVSFIASGCTSARGLNPEEKRVYISDMHDDVVAKMSEKYPEVNEKIEKAPGYGVFSNVNVNLIFASAGNGFGMVVNKNTGEKTYMKMALIGGGLGFCKRLQAADDIQN